MPSPAAQTRTPVEWLIQPVSVRAISFSVARLVVPLYLSFSSLPRTDAFCFLDRRCPLRKISTQPFDEDENLSDQDLKALKTMIDRRRKDKDKERHNA